MDFSDLSVGSWKASKREAEKVGLGLDKLFKKDLSGALDDAHEAAKAMTARRLATQEKLSRFDDLRADTHNIYISYKAKIRKIEVKKPEDQKHLAELAVALEAVQTGKARFIDWPRAKDKFTSKTGIKVDRLFDEGYVDTCLKRNDALDAFESSKEQHRATWHKWDKARAGAQNIALDYIEILKAYEKKKAAEWNEKQKAAVFNMRQTLSRLVKVLSGEPLQTWQVKK